MVLPPCVLYASDLSILSCVFGELNVTRSAVGHIKTALHKPAAPVLFSSRLSFLVCVNV